MSKFVICLTVKTVNEKENVGDREKAGQLPANEKQKKEKEREGHAFSAALNHLRDQTL